MLIDKNRVLLNDRLTDRKTRNISIYRNVCDKYELTEIGRYITFIYAIYIYIYTYIDR